MISGLVVVDKKLTNFNVIKEHTGFNKNHLRDPELTARFRKIKADLKEMRRTLPNRVVFFGDGSFSSCAKGSPPIARKAFLKTTLWVAMGGTYLN